MLRANEISTSEMKLEIQACNLGGGVEKLLTNIGDEHEY